jgi:hypothetical protein
MEKGVLMACCMEWVVEERVGVPQMVAHPVLHLAGTLHLSRLVTAGASPSHLVDSKGPSRGLGKFNQIPTSQHKCNGLGRPMANQYLEGGAMELVDLQNVHRPFWLLED